MHPDVAKLLWDALTAAQRIDRFVAGRDFARYLDDEMLRAAVERQFEIIGEALNRARRVDPGVSARIPELDRIVAFRNILIHSYATVDHRLVWGVVETKLDDLVATLRGLLDSSGISDPSTR